MVLLEGVEAICFFGLLLNLHCAEGLFLLQISSPPRYFITAPTILSLRHNYAAGESAERPRREKRRHRAGENAR